MNRGSETTLGTPDVQPTPFLVLLTNKESKAHHERDSIRPYQLGSFDIYLVDITIYKLDM